MEKLEIIKICSKHGETKFYYNVKYNKYFCKKCIQQNVDKRKKNKKQKLVEYKGGKCEICGYDKCIDALEFHHLNPEEKDFNISQNISKNLDFLKKEVDKCILVCSNCHREIHNKLNEEKRKKEFLQQEEYFEQHKKLNKIDSLDYDTVISYVKEGLKKSEISKKLNVSIATLTRFFSKNGINMSRKTFSFKENEIPTEEILKQLRNEGMSFAKIGKRFHFSRNYISSLCKKYNIK